MEHRERGLELILNKDDLTIEQKEYSAMLQDVLDYIEKESYCWDVQDLLENGFNAIIELVLQASCKVLFLNYSKIVQINTDLVLPESFLIDESKFYYCDCLCYFCKQALQEISSESIMVKEN